MRFAASKDKEKVLPLVKRGQVIEKPEDLIKDVYVFEFLKIPEPYIFSENELESRLIDKLQNFLLELGKGFAFVGNILVEEHSNKEVLNIGCILAPFLPMKDYSVFLFCLCRRRGKQRAMRPGNGPAIQRPPDLLSCARGYAGICPYMLTFFRMPGYAIFVCRKIICGRATSLMGGFYFLDKSPAKPGLWTMRGKVE